MHAWPSFTAYLKHKFGQKVRKIPLDAGFGCPNRDGSLAYRGCIFCNEQGSGSGLGLDGVSIEEQWRRWSEHYRRRSKANLFLAYLQSFSNTYGPLRKLADLMNRLHDLPDIAGISIGTRPDCIDKEKLSLISHEGWDESWIEFGVQSFQNVTLQAINRGHDAACSIRAINAAADAGLQVCAHIMFGLPGETPEMMAENIRVLNDLPVHGVKLHNVYVSRGTELERMMRSGLYMPLSEAVYEELAAWALAELRSDILIHRVVSDPTPQELIAPEWALYKSDVLRSIQRLYHRNREGLLASGDNVFPTTKIFDAAHVPDNCPTRPSVRRVWTAPHRELK